MSAVDLLGDPIDPHHGCRGRPRHIPTAERRRQARELRAAGASQEAIAAALGITIPTLTRHYRREIGRGWRTTLHKQEGETNAIDG